MNDMQRLEPGAGPVLGESPLKERQWTFMVYMAGDNNLEDHGRRDIEELKAVGSTPEVAIVVQFDRMEDDATRRYYLHKGTKLHEDEVPSQTWSETNTGDPRELALFLHWAITTYPAENYGLVLWNHGSGWKEDDIYRRALSQEGARARHRVAVSSAVESIVAGSRLSPLFSSSLDIMLTKGIAYDDTSADFLDNAELKRALDAGLLFGGVERLSLLGFDACLMSMLEVAYQVRSYSGCLVASQDNEPAEGWPYAKILAALTDRPSMTAEDLAAVVVDSYASTHEDETSTMAAMRTDVIQDVVSALDLVCQFVIENLAQCEFIMGRASRRAQRFSDPDYKDLHDLCRIIHEKSAHLPVLRERAATVMGLLAPPGADRLVMSEAHRGARVEMSHGVSIYFPSHQMSPFYRRLDFASESLWDDMLHALIDP